MLPMTAARTSADCDRPERVIHLYGDSIFRGWALRTFTPAPTHPLYSLRSPTSTIAALFAEHGIPDAVVYAGCVLGGRPGAPSFSDPVVTPESIRQAIADGAIRPGDLVVLEEAGQHVGAADWYEDAFVSLRAAATDTVATTLLMLTTPDYRPAREDCQYDRPLSDGRTLNQIVRAVASAERPYPGRTLLVDLDAEMDRCRAAALARDGVDLMHGDGVHPNVWGQLLVVGQILCTGGYLERLISANGLRELVAANADLLAYGARTFTPRRAREYVTWLLFE
ncbi:MAG: hypothetical protein IT305_25895 [Chloroflexi bacterium]|nr:hypothetical protein [Chloroflexota bacterium]